MIRCSCKNDKRIRGRKYFYSTEVILGCFVILGYGGYLQSIIRISCNESRSLYNKKIIITCGISALPNTRIHNTGLEYSISRY